MISCCASPCPTDSWVGEDLGLSPGCLTERQWLVAVTSGSQPASYDCPVPALHLSLTMLHVLSQKRPRHRRRLFALSALLVSCILFDLRGSWISFYVSAELGQFCWMASADMGY